MRDRDLFGVALRVLGIWFLYMAGYDGVFLGMKVGGMAINSTVPAAENKIFVGYYLLIAMVLLIFADHLVQLVYGRVAKADPEE